MRRKNISHEALSCAKVCLWVLFSIILLNTGIPSVRAEEAVEMVTDRPDQTESPSIVPPGHVQVETGGLFVNEEFSERGIDFDIETLSLAATLVRIGISPTLEFRIGGEFTQETFTYNRFVRRNSGLSGIATGAKIKLTEEKGWLPESAFIVELDLPVGHEEFRPSEVQPAMRFAAAHTISDAISLGYNIGGAWDLDTRNAALLYTASLGVSFAEKWGMFYELFGDFNSDAKNRHSFDLGGTYLLHTNVQLDAAVGYGLNDAADDWFLLTGITFRLPQ
jgi:hypothetical protein